MNPTPTIGRIVLCSNGYGKDHAAIVCDVGRTDSPVPPTLDLTVFAVTGSVVAYSVPHDDDPAMDGIMTWRWMPYQKAVAAGEITPTLHATPVPLSELTVPFPGHVAAPVAVPGLQVDEAISARSATAPRVTVDDLAAAVVAENFFLAGYAAQALGQPTNPAMDLLTICVLTIANGFTVVGTSAPASPANFDAEKGRIFAKENAMRQLWPLMGFSLRDRLDRQAAMSVGDVDYGTRI